MIGLSFMQNILTVVVHALQTIRVVLARASRSLEEPGFLWASAVLLAVGEPVGLNTWWW